MIRALFIAAILFSVFSHASKLDERIKKSENTLKNAESEKKQTNEQLSRIAASIKNTEKEIAKLQKKLDILEKEKKSGEDRYLSTKKKIDALDEQIKGLDRSIKEKRNAFIKRISEQFSLLIAARRLNKGTPESVIKQEIYNAYKKANAVELNELEQAIAENNRKKEGLENDRKNLKKSIEEISKKHEQYRKKKAKTEILLKKLAKDEKLYRAKLKNLITRQNLLRLTLAKLNILRKDEIEEARRREAERKAQLAKRARQLELMRKQRSAEREKAKREGRSVDYSTPAISESTNAGKVKQYGSSYHKERVYAYRGAKTISPVSGARIVKKFGTYVDPIYKIKIFNDSITLKAPKSNAKVYNVLNGKVVYVGESSMLGKVVIVAHGGKLHTVYAGLSKISSLVKNGNKIKKGMVIGKVKRKLIFQATKNSKLINPVRLIRI